MDKDYFLNLEKIKQSHSFITAEEVEMKKKSQKRQIIDLLLERFPGRATNLELNKIGFRYGQRIKELREDGWEIENVRDRSQSGKVWVAWLESPVKGDRAYVPKYAYDPRVEEPAPISQVEIFQEKQRAFKF